VIQTRKLLAFSFWEFRRILLAVSGDWLVDFRAMVLLAVTQACVAFCALELGELSLGRRLIPGSEPGVTVFELIFALAIAAVNHYAISRKAYWKRYEREFDGYSKTAASSTTDPSRRTCHDRNPLHTPRRNMP